MSSESKNIEEQIFSKEIDDEEFSACSGGKHYKCEASKTEYNQDCVGDFEYHFFGCFQKADNCSFSNTDYYVINPPKVKDPHK